jgi:multidrug resistance efflux pump
MPESGIDKPRPRKRVYGALLAGVVAVGSLALVAITQEPKKAVSSNGPPKTVSVPQMASTKSEAEILFRGKSFCVVKRKMIMPFSGEIIKVPVEEGHAVGKDATLAEYKLDREAVIHVQRILYPEQVLNLKKILTDQTSELDKLTKATLPIRESEQERLEREFADIQELQTKNMVSRDGVANKQRDMEAVRKQVMEVRQTILQAKAGLAKTQEDLRYYEEKQKKDVDLLEWQTNRSYSDSSLPVTTAFLKAPIAGQVIWVAPELTDRAELNKGFEAAVIASMSPMVVRCKVHELDLVRLKSGDRGSVTFDAMPGKRYACKVTKIPWVSRNPALDVPADYEIECLLENADDGIKDGLTCNVKIHVTE